MLQKSSKTASERLRSGLLNFGDEIRASRMDERTKKPCKRGPGMGREPGVQGARGPSFLDVFPSKQAKISSELENSDEKFESFAISRGKCGKER